MKKTIATYVGIVAAVTGVGLLGISACNDGLNKKTIHHPTYTLVSYPTGISGHVEFLRYNDGSHQVRMYPTPTIFSDNNQLLDDLNGDGLVDRIHENSSYQWGLNQHEELFIREHDYGANKEKFDHADQQLKSLMAKYSSKAK